MFRRSASRIVQALPVRQIVVGAAVFFALVTLVTFFHISAYLDRAASSKRASQGPTVVRPINSALPVSPDSVETLPDPGPGATPSAVPSPVPANTRNLSPAQFPRNSSARTSAGTQGMTSVYSGHRQENYGR